MPLDYRVLTSEGFIISWIIGKALSDRIPMEDLIDFENLIRKKIVDENNLKTTLELLCSFEDALMAMFRNNNFEVNWK